MYWMNNSEQDYKLQRLVKVLNENYQMSGSDAEQEQVTNSPQQERADHSPIDIVADDDDDTVLIYQRSPQQNIGQNLSSMASLQEESRSTIDQSNHTQLENNKTPERDPGECNATENHKTDLLREMLKLLKENPDKAKQDVRKYGHLTIWDFAGQYAFYTTHQMFLTRRAIYLLVSDVSGQITDLVEDECYFDTEGKMKCKVHELVEIWMNSIHSCAPPDNENVNSAISFTVIPPPVILVGTHVDKIGQNQMGMFGNYGGNNAMPVVSGDDIPDVRNPFQCDPQVQMERRELGHNYLTEIRSYLRDKPTIIHLVDKDFAIDNTVVDSELENLKMKIMDVAAQQPYWGEEIPTRWFLLEQQLMKIRDAGVKVISRNTVEALNLKGAVQLKEGEELDLFLKYLHETGTIIYFSIEVLRENIVLDPKWLIDALKSLINAQPDLPNQPADNGTQSDSPADSDSVKALTQKWMDFKEKGILSSELVDAIWTKEKHPELHDNKRHILLIMEQFNIIAKPRSFSEIGEKVENYFLTPCMLRQESPREVISPEHDQRLVSTPVLCYIFRGKYLPPPIFHRLIAACVTRWPVAKKKETSENLIFCGCCVFDIGLFHRLTLHCRTHIVFARITRMLVDEVKTPDAKLCTRVRKFITLNLSKITSYLGQNLQFELRLQYPKSQDISEDSLVCVSPPFEMWFADEGHDSDTPITPEHMNHSRLCVALVTVCGDAMRQVLRTQVPAPHTDIYQAILANRINLTRRQGRPLLNSDQSQLVFPDPQGRKTGTLDQFDLSLLYTLIRNVSSVPAPLTGWGNDPLDQPRDRSLGASVERIRSYRNHISGHSADGKMSQNALEDYWNKFEAVLHDIEAVIGGQVYSQELVKQKRQVISIYEAC
ncbi:hypothetical protein CHS0354_002875 [Potamilus streckersoni]|uniref:C-terminal of Roc (COR) domain-containing protein n=1 Tax=Potamilus streckersoni TaxID=2493646 RepID=A0AAE0VZD9_9BIVA|nr:hypothetical protein CHS0354_002875 [Potamilus streckersoni]